MTTEQASGPGRTPFARLFAVGYRTLIEDLHRELHSRGWTDVRPAYGFVLLAAADVTTVGDLAALMGMTKQAASKLVDDMVGGGYLGRSTAGADARRKDVRLTARGRALLDEVESIYREMDERWAATLGADRIERVRTDLETVLLDPDTHQLPPIRPLW